MSRWRRGACGGGALALVLAGCGGGGGPEVSVTLLGLRAEVVRVQIELHPDGRPCSEILARFSDDPLEPLLAVDLVPDAEGHFSTQMDGLRAGRYRVAGQAWGALEVLGTACEADALRLVDGAESSVELRFQENP